MKNKVGRHVIKICIIKLFIISYLIYLSPKSKKPLTIFKATGCSFPPPITFYPLGRLGNLISSYANFIVLSRELGYQLVLPEKFKRNMGKTFKNVSFPQSEGENNSSLYESFVIFETLDEFLNTWEKCRSGGFTSCIPSTSGNQAPVKIMAGHNVSDLLTHLKSSYSLSAREPSRRHWNMF